MHSSRGCKEVKRWARRRKGEVDRSNVSRNMSITTVSLSWSGRIKTARKLGRKQEGALMGGRSCVWIMSERVENSSH